MCRVETSTSVVMKAQFISSSRNSATSRTWKYLKRNRLHVISLFDLAFVHIPRISQRVTFLSNDKTVNNQKVVRKCLIERFLNRRFESCA
jgi:hypothetical protein